MENEVEPIIGKTDVFIYPHGAQDRGSKAYQYLVHDEGFKFLAGVGPNNFTDIGNDSVYQDRVAIDGLNLYDFKYKLKPFLDRVRCIVRKIVNILKEINPINSML